MQKFESCDKSSFCLSNNLILKKAIKCGCNKSYKDLPNLLFLLCTFIKSNTFSYTVSTLTSRSRSFLTHFFLEDPLQIVPKKILLHQWGLSLKAESIVLKTDCITDILLPPFCCWYCLSCTYLSPKNYFYYITTTFSRIIHCYYYTMPNANEEMYSIHSYWSRWDIYLLLYVLL